MPAEVAFRFECGGAALAGGGDGLAVVVVGDVAGGEEAGGFGGGAAGLLEDVAVFVLVDEVAEEGAVRDVADGDEDAGDFEFAFGAIEEVFEGDGAHFSGVVGEVFADGGVPDGLDLGVGEGAVRHDFGGAEFIAAVDEVDFAGEAGEEGGFLAGAVSAADDADGDIAVEGSVAGGAGSEAAADE